MDTAEARDMAKMAVTLLVVTLVVASAVTLLAMILRWFNKFHERSMQATTNARNERMFILSNQANGDEMIPVQTIRNTLAEYDTMDIWYINIVIMKYDATATPPTYIEASSKFYTYKDEADFESTYNDAVKAAGGSAVSFGAGQIVSDGIYIDKAVAQLNHYGNNLCQVGYSVGEDGYSSIQIKIYPVLSGV